jgi:hypothetical protein
LPQVELEPMRADPALSQWRLLLKPSRFNCTRAATVAAAWEQLHPSATREGEPKETL